MSQHVIRNKGELVQKKNVERHSSDSWLKLMRNIFDPFSSSMFPLFQTRMPCCIHLGKFS